MQADRPLPDPADHCFCCGHKLRLRSVTVYCDDDQAPAVGPDCAAKVRAAGETGYQPPRGGPRVWSCKAWTPSAKSGAPNV